MAIEQHFYIDTTAARHELCDVLIDAGLGFQVQPDWKTPSGRLGSGAINEATAVSILDDLSYRNSRLAEIPTLLRREGRPVLAQALTENNEQWDAEREPYRAMVDLPYVLEPLGPWPDVPNQPYLPYDPAAEGPLET